MSFPSSAEIEALRDQVHTKAVQVDSTLRAGVHPAEPWRALECLRRADRELHSAFVMLYVREQHPSPPADDVDRHD